MYRTLFLVASALLVLSLAGAAHADLVARWEFDGDTADSSGNGLDGTLVGDAKLDFGLFGGALSLDGDGDYLVVEGYKGINADRTDPDNPSQLPFTVALWIKMNNSNGSLINWGSSDGTGVGGQYQNFRINGGRLRAEHGNGRFRGATRVDDGEWHHVVMAVEEGANIESPRTLLYVDGEEDPEGADTVNDQNIWNLTEDADVAIGTRASHIDRFFNGLIDDARIYDHKLTQEEVQAMMQAYAEMASDPSPA
ncbi:MAG: LamG domain-containing protein, partial [Planctomycetota bacterium]